MNHWIPNREQLLASRWLAPVAHWLHDERLWHFERGSVARAVAIGVFFGLLLPFAQFLAAVVVSVWLRGHVAVAAGATLISNPLTFPPIYWLAYRLGRALLGDPAGENEGPDLDQAAAAEGWIAGLWHTVQQAGAPLMLGLALLAVVGAAVGFTLVWLLWRTQTRGRETPPA